jgi:hypothetical protein
MTSWKTSEIVRHLAERDGVEPPEGLLETIKSQIPAELPALPADTLTEIGERRREPRRRVWLMAASLAAAVGAGVLGLRVMQTMPRQEAALEKTAREQELPRQVTPAAPPALPVPPQILPQRPRAATSQGGVAEAPSPSMDAGAAKEKKAEAPRSDLKALGYLGEGRAKTAPSPQAVPARPALRPPSPPAPAKPAAPPEEKVSALAESPLEGGVPGGVAGGTAGSAKDAAPLLDQRSRGARDPWAVLQTRPEVLTDRINVGGNESGQQSGYAGPAGPASVRRSLEAGRLPPPGAVRVEDFVSSFSYGDAPPVREDFAVRAEGAPTPFAPEAGTRLLRFNIRSSQTVFRDARAQVEFNPEVVSRWRLLGSEDRPLTRGKLGGDIGPAGPIGAGQSVTALYEVHLKPGVTGSQKIATLHLRFHAAGSGEARETTRDLRVADLAPSWETAPPGLRLASLAAELAEVLRGSSGVEGAGLDDLLRRSQQLSAELAKSSQGAEAADLLRMVEETARLKRQGEN